MFRVIPSHEVKMADYERVATMDFVAACNVFKDEIAVIAALEHVYEKTNSIDHHWSENPEVMTVIENCRSTSVGDIIALDGVKYMVASFGFSKL